MRYVLGLAIIIVGIYPVGLLEDAIDPHVQSHVLQTIVHGVILGLLVALAVFVASRGRQSNRRR